MGIWMEPIRKAQARAQEEGLDLRSLSAYVRDKKPIELGSAEQHAQRSEFLRRSLSDEERSIAFFERIINGNEIQDINYLARGARAAKAVARIVIRDSSGRRRGFGSGFLVAPRVLLTNHHVLPDLSMALRSEVQFEFELDIDGQPLDGVIHSLQPRDLFFASQALDFAVVAVSPKPLNADSGLEHYGFLPLVGSTGKVMDGEWLTIIQHPNGERKQVCVRENKLLRRDRDVLWYATDTLGGSSGSPVFNNDWYVVALHHSGIPEERDGRMQTIYGRDFDAARDGEQDIKWVANEGIRVSRIVETLQAELPNHELLQPIYRATPENSRILLPSAAVLQATPTVSLLPDATTGVARDRIPQRQETPMNDGTPILSTGRTVQVTLSIAADGQVRVVDSARGGFEATAWLEKRSGTRRAPSFDVEFDATYKDRKGYKPDFLDPGFVVALPKLSPALEAKAAKLVESPNDYHLKYHGCTIVMDAKRRLAMFSAANVNFSGRHDLPRPADVWRTDPRILSEHQLPNFYYAANQFDRGHLTRREDMEYGGTPLEALVSAADTCHWTNCTPQHARFNQNKELWQGIERHILEEGIKTNRFRAQVITGPILDEGDPVWKKYEDIQYPVRFWKVVVAVNGKKQLFATAYILDQSEVVSRFGIEAAPDVPFTDFGSFQVPIAEVERLTQLSFMGGPAGHALQSLSDFDPLSINPRPRRPGRGFSRHESLLAMGVPESYVPLDSLDAIRL